MYSIHMQLWRDTNTTIADTCKLFLGSVIGLLLLKVLWYGVLFITFFNVVLLANFVDI